MRIGLFNDLGVEHGVEQQVHIDKPLGVIHVQRAFHIMVKRESLCRPVQTTT